MRDGKIVVDNLYYDNLGIARPSSASPRSALPCDRAVISREGVLQMTIGTKESREQFRSPARGSWTR